MLRKRACERRDEAGCRLDSCIILVMYLYKSVAIYVIETESEPRSVWTVGAGHQGESHCTRFNREVDRCQPLVPLLSTQ
jgi:hypothetical protein